MLFVIAARYRPRLECLKGKEPWLKQGNETQTDHGKS